jgi:hypothetical protein
MSDQQQEPMHVWTEVAPPADVLTSKHTYRMRVPGGWLYRYGDFTETAAATVVFVPDPTGIFPRRGRSRN